MTKLSLSLVVLLAACGGKPPATSAPEATAALPDVPFRELSHEQRVEFMKQKVVPAMKPIFQNHDPKRYAEFGCVTCHGEQAKEQHFDMPNPNLPKIGYTQEFYAKFKPADLEWMGKEVMPTMADLLKLPTSYTDPAPKDGFGCAGCHTFDPDEKRPAAP